MRDLKKIISYNSVNSADSSNFLIIGFEKRS